MDETERTTETLKVALADALTGRGMSEEIYTEMTALLRADTEAALRSIVQTLALAERLGIALPTPQAGSDKRGPTVSATKGKSKPNLAGWLRRATEDGSLPVPNDVLIVSDRMVHQGLAAGYIAGTGHPYQITVAGRAYATANYKGRLVARG